MKRPAILTMFLGHPVVTLTIYALCAFMGYQWWRGETPGGAALFGLILGCFCYRANARAEQFRLWQREWDAMAGNPPRDRITMPGLRLVGQGVAFGFLGLLSLAYLNDPAIGWAAWLAVVLLCVGAIRAAWRRRRAVRHARAPHSVRVTLCLRSPAQSPSWQSAYAALPEHCRAIMQ